MDILHRSPKILKGISGCHSQECCDQWVWVLWARRCLGQKQAGEEKAMLCQFQQADFSIWAKTRGPQVALEDLVAVIGIQSIVAGKLFAALQTAIELAGEAAGYQVNHLG